MLIQTSDVRPFLRVSPPPSFNDKLFRWVWGLVEVTLFGLSPVPFHGWRRFLLRLFGARIASGAHIYPSTRIWAPWNIEMADGSCLGPRVHCYSATLVSLGKGAIVSQGAHLCAATHDLREPDFPLVVGEIRIGDEAWVCADAFVGPGVTIGGRAVAGARAVVTKDVEPGMVVAGNPARTVSAR